MQDRYKFRGKRIANNQWYYGSYLCLHNPPKYDWNGTKHENKEDIHFIVDEKDVNYGVYSETIGQCTSIKDKNGKLIYEGDIIVIPNQYPFYDYKNKEDMKQDLNFTKGEIKGESILNYVGVVEWIYSQWQYVYHCVNPNKQGISEGINQGLNDFGFDEAEKTCYEVIGNIYENPELLKEVK